MTNEGHRIHTNSIIEVEHLHKRYGNHIAVADVSFEVAEGEIFGLLGPNGAGKTTTAECVSGLRRRDGGRVRVAGVDPVQDRHVVRRLVGVQLQHSRLPDKLTVGEAVTLFASFYARPRRPRELLDELGIGELWSARYATLSGGQQQRVSVALALIGDPRIAILDELTTGLDPGARREIWSMLERLRDRGVTIVLVSHFMEEAERLCDRVAVIEEQRIGFDVNAPIDADELAALPGVRTVRIRAGAVTISGGADALPSVLSFLASRHLTAANLRVDQGNLEDAFVALTTGARP
jgi:ABC-2 type transport system ATP-binding protein